MMHRLVARAFHGDPPTPKHTVNHKNNITTDNRAENLEWATMREQIIHSFKTNPNRYGKTGRSKPVQGRKVGEKNWSLSFSSAREAARTLKVTQGGISAVCNKRGNCRTCKGYEFRYTPNEIPDTLDGEIWKEFRPDPAYGKRVFQISNHGRISSPNGIISYGFPQKNGYRNFWHRGKVYRIHAIVLSLFVSEKPSPTHTVNHKDLDPGNNHVSNLEWATPKDQILHSLANNPNRRTGSKSLSKPVEVRPHESDIEWVKYKSVSEASADLNITTSQISKVCQGVFSQTRGYVFRFADSGVPDLLPGEVWKTIEVTV